MPKAPKHQCGFSVKTHTSLFLDWEGALFEQQCVISILINLRLTEYLHKIIQYPDRINKYKWEIMQNWLH